LVYSTVGGGEGGIMSEDESKFSDVEGIENDEEYADLKPSLLNDNESLAVRPMFITGITANQIVNRDHSFNWTLNTDGRHNAFLELITNGTRFWYEHFDMIDGRSVNTQRVMLNAPAAVQLNHKWDKDNDTSGWHHFYYYASDLPVIDNKSTFTNEVTGSGGASSLVSAWVHNGNGISLDVTPTNSRWSLRLFSSVPPGTYEIVILQRVSGYDQRYSARKTITYLAAPKISTPKEGEVVKLNAAMSVTGTWGAPNRHIQLTNAGGSSELGSDPANSRGEWAISFNAKDRYPSGGPTELNVRHIDSGNAAWTKLNIFLLAPPTLTTTASEVEMSTTIEGAGHTGSEFFVNVFLDGSTNPIGGGPVTNARWSAAVRFSTPGPHSVTAEQIYGSVRSDRGTSRLYLVRPLLPTLAVESVGEDIFLSGTGYKGVDTKVHINIHYVDDNFLTPLVDDKGGWMIKVPATLVPNNYEFSCRQSVPDGGTGRIYSSGWTNKIPITVRTPVPTGMTVTVNGQRATFSGRGRQWGTHEVKIGIYNNGVALAGVPQATVQTNLTWSTTATADLAPGVYTNLTARQGVNTQWSTHSVKFSMTVASPPPEFTNPPEGVPAGQRPEISGRAWPGSAIVLKISGKPDVSLTATGGTFKLTATEDWAPGTYTITATAAFGGGQPSSPRTRTFTVKTPVPTITTAANAEVDLVPVIKGTGFKNCWVVVYSSTHQELGGGLVGENREWEAELTERAPGNLIIYAVQKESRSSSNISTPTAQRTVKVRVPKSGITVPAQNGRPARTSMFTGTTTASEGTVELSIKGEREPFIKGIPLKPDGSWEETLTLSVGLKTVEARLRQKTYLSDPFERVITVVPGVPVIDTPRNGEALGRLLRISGFGHPADTVHVQRTGNAYNFDPVTVKEDGTWSANFVHDMIATNGIKAFARAGAGLDSLASSTSTFLLLGPAPQITEPLPGDWVGERPLYSGLATPGARITVASWFNPEDVLAPPTEADNDGRWAVVGNKALPVGAARVIMRQTVDGKASEWAESGRFMVERKPGQFEAPTVGFPLNGQKVGRWPMFSGMGEPGADIFICKVRDMNEVLATTRVDRNGKWAARSQIELPVAGSAYTYSVRQSRDGATSNWLLPNRTVEVIQVPDAFERPIIDLPVNDAAQELERMPPFAGRGMPGAELNVYLYPGQTTVLATTTVDAQGNWSVRCAVELAVQTDAHRIWARQSMDDKLSAMSGALIQFKVAEKIDRPVIVSPVANAQISPREVIRGTAMPGVEVRLYRAGNPGVVWGKGVADARGQWVIVMDGLPLGDFKMAGRGYKDTLLSPSMLETDFTVIDAS